MAEMRFEHVSKQYGRTSAVEDLDLHVRDGEFLVLVGPSGCGKSTALRMIAGLEEISAGDLYIGERRVNDLPPRDRDIAMVFQSYALYPHMSVFDNMAFALKLHHVPRAEMERRVREAAGILGIAELLDRKPKQLSGGQRQRVALGRAIVREPQVFLMDEPLSNLDAKLRVEMRAEIGKLHQRLGVTTIYVTHDQVEAMTMGDRIAVLRAGVLQQLDTPMMLYEHPRNVFVAGFIGSPAMNFFNGTVTGTDGQLFLDAPGLRLPVLPQRAPELTPHLGHDVIFGIRPEHMQTADLAAPDERRITIPALVEVVEPMGSEIFLHLRSGPQSFTVRVDPRTQTAPGEQLDVAVAIDKVHVFDPETEEAMTGESPEVAEPPQSTTPDVAA